MPFRCCVRDSKKSERKSHCLSPKRFPAKRLANSVELQQQFLAMPKDDFELQLVDCVPERHENLTLVSIQPQQEVLVAGVPALINVTIRNNGITQSQFNRSNYGGRLQRYDHRSENDRRLFGTGV